MLTLARSVFVRSYRPNTGLAAARMDVRAFNVACIPEIRILVLSVRITVIVLIF